MHFVAHSMFHSQKMKPAQLPSKLQNFQLLNQIIAIMDKLCNQEIVVKLGEHGELQCHVLG